MYVIIIGIMLCYSYNGKSKLHRLYDHDDDVDGGGHITTKLCFGVCSLISLSLYVYSFIMALTL